MYKAHCVGGECGIWKRAMRRLTGDHSARPSRRRQWLWEFRRDSEERATEVRCASRLDSDTGEGSERQRSRQDDLPVFGRASQHGRLLARFGQEDFDLFADESLVDLLQIGRAHV